MKKLRIYLDTSTIGGCFDEEFSIPSKILFEMFDNKIYIPVISEIVIKELENAPKQVKEKINNLNNIEFVRSNDEIIELATLYIKNKAVNENYFDDALHIAIATFYNVDILVSWNFKHIVNINKIHQFNSINISNNFSILEIRSPLEVIANE